MILKYSILGILALFILTASDPYFGVELSFRPAPKEEAGDVRERMWMKTDAMKPYLEDYDNRVSDIFKFNKFYYPNVHFWFLIYTQFESSSVVLHDKTNLSLIYKVLDFSALVKKGLSRNTRYVLQQKIANEKEDELRADLALLAKDPFSLTPESKKIYHLLKQAGIRVPVGKIERKNFFLKLRDNLRTQTGQKDFIRAGVKRSLVYQPFLKKYFMERNLPTELLAVPFLESSFNPRAHSKANALGVWQFMPLIASYFLPKRTLHIDYRSNVGVSSLSASWLMSENIKIMKSWDLAVTAYNSGTKHLLKTKRELAVERVSLEAIIKHSDSQHFGFASKNFYSEFLALAHTLAYEEELFEELHEAERTDASDDLRFFLAKCSMRLSKDIPVKFHEEIEYYNHHLKDLSNTISRSTIVTTKSQLPSGKFLEIEYKNLLKLKPKDWEKLVRGYSCSTR